MFLNNIKDIGVYFTIHNSIYLSPPEVQKIENFHKSGNPSPTLKKCKNLHLLSDFGEMLIEKLIFEN